MVKKISAKKNYLAAFFIIAFGFSWFFWFFDVLSSFHVITLPFSYMILFIVGAHGPLVAALIMTYKLGGWSAVKDLLRSGFNLRMPLTWWLVILALPVILGGLAWWINGSINDFQFDFTQRIGFQTLSQENISSYKINAYFVLRINFTPDRFKNLCRPICYGG
jgi:hypothetical protein